MGKCAECWAFKGHQCIEYNTKLDPIDFYRSYLDKLPTMSVIALNLFAMPVGEAPAERLFSTSTRIMTFDRQRITPKNLAMVAFIKRNRKGLM